MKLWKTTCQGIFPSEVISEDFITFYEDSVKNNQRLVVKSIKDDSQLIERRYLCSFFPQSEYNVPLLSNPDVEVGLIGIDFARKKLIYDAEGFPLHTFKDIYVLENAQSETLFVDSTFEDILKEFIIGRGYVLHKFKPLSRDFGSSLNRHNCIQKVQLGEKLSLNDILVF